MFPRQTFRSAFQAPVQHTCKKVSALPRQRPVGRSVCSQAQPTPPRHRSAGSCCARSQDSSSVQRYTEEAAGVNSSLNFSVGCRDGSSRTVSALEEPGEKRHSEEDGHAGAETSGSDDKGERRRSFFPGPPPPPSGDGLRQLVLMELVT